MFIGDGSVPYAKIYRPRDLKLNLTDFLEKAVIVCFFSAFSIILVGYSHGGRQRMSIFDPSLKNSITTFGKKCIYFSIVLIFLAIIFALLSLKLI